MFLNSGLTNDNVEVVCAAFQLVHQDELASLFLTCNELQTLIINLLLEEMFSTRSDIVYWERFRRGSSWEITLSRLNSRAYGVLFPQETNMEDLFQEKNDLIEYIESLRADFNTLAVFLAKVNHAGSFLKKVHADVQRNSVFNHSTRAALLLADKALDDVDVKKAVSGSMRVAQNVYHAAVEDLKSFFNTLTSAISDHMPHDVIYEVIPGLGPEDIARSSLYHLNATAQNLLQMFHTYPCFVDGFPLGIAKLKVQRPSYFERYWVRNLIATVGAVFLLETTVSSIRSGELQRSARILFEAIQSKLTEHVIEPVTKLAGELFDTIRKRDHIVSQQDLEMSRQALERMLTDFSQSQQGHDLLKRWNEIKSKSDDLLNSIPGIHSNASDANVVVPVPPAVEFAPTPDQAWEALMNEYERELQSPIRGIIYGNLFTAMLIQMQKLKVHTEAAMLTMDQILASNELTIAATAAMPALIAFGTGVYWLRSLFQPKAQTPGAHTLHFRLILCDVERALLHLQELVHKQEQQDAESGDDNEATPQAKAATRTNQQRVIHQALGLYSFHVARLRSKFLEMFDLRSPNAEVRLKGASTSAAAYAHARAQSKHKPTLDLHNRRQSSARLEKQSQKLADQRSQLFGLLQRYATAHPMASTSSTMSSLTSMTTQFFTTPLIRSRTLASSASTDETEGPGTRLDIPNGTNSLTLSSSLSLALQVIGHTVSYLVGCVLLSIREAEDFVSSLHWLLWGSNAEYLSNTTLYNSIETDILLLECPLHEVSLARKVEIIRGMRSSYKVLSPLM